MRTWVRALVTAPMVAALVGAGQLGIAYGLGILHWDQRFPAGAWKAHLGWVTWIGALAVVGGAVAGAGTLRRAAAAARRAGRLTEPAAPARETEPAAPARETGPQRPEPGFGAWIAVALTALAGAAVVLPLVALPARAAEVPPPLDPALNAGLAATIGLLVGLFAALAVLCARPVAGSVFVTTCWVWTAGIVSAVARVGETFPRGAGARTAPAQRLGVLELPGLGDRSVLPVMAGMALLTGLLIAVYARWLGEHPVAVAAGGLAGPALIAAAYLVAGPSNGPVPRDPYLAALIGVGAGTIAAIPVAFVRRRRASPDPPVAEPPPPVAPPPPRVPVREDEYVTWVSGLGPGESDPPPAEEPATEPEVSPRAPRARRAGRSSRAQPR